MVTALAYIIGLAQAATIAWLAWERYQRLASARQTALNAGVLANHHQQLEQLDARCSDRLRDCDQLFANAHINRKAKT